MSNQIITTVTDATATQKGVSIAGGGGTPVKGIDPIVVSDTQEVSIKDASSSQKGVVTLDQVSQAITFEGDSGSANAVNQIMKFLGDLEHGLQIVASTNQLQFILLDSSPVQKGVIQIADSVAGIAGEDETLAMTPKIVQLKLGNMTKNAVVLGNGLGLPFSYSNIGQDPFTLLLADGNNKPIFVRVVSQQDTLSFDYVDGEGLLDINVKKSPLVFLSTAQSLSTNTSYIFTEGDFSYPLPAVSAMNDVLELKLQGADSYTITQADGQSIIVGGNTTIVGTEGSLMCNGSGDWIRLKCTEANKTWMEFGISGSSFIIT